MIFSHYHMHWYWMTHVCNVGCCELFDGGVLTVSVSGEPRPESLSLVTNTGLE